MKFKKVLSMVMVATMLMSNAVFANTVDAVDANTNAPAIFAEDIDTTKLQFDENGEALIEGAKVTTYSSEGSAEDNFETPKKARLTSTVDGGTFEFGLRMFLLKFYQFSYYTHPSKTHYANAMINDVYTGRKTAAAGKTAVAETNKYESYSTHNSYYGF